MEREVDVVVIGAGPVGENVADRVQGGRPRRGARRARARRRRVLVLGVHAVEGAAAQRPPPCAPRGASPARRRRSPASSTSPRCSRRRDYWVVHDWDDDGPGRLARERGHRRWCAGTAGSPADARVVVSDADGSSVDARRAARRRRRHRHPTRSCPTSPASPRPTPWTSREATSAKEVPARLADHRRRRRRAPRWRRRTPAFGTEVTVLARSGLLGDMEPFAGDAVAEALREAGVDGALGVEPTRRRARRRRRGRSTPRRRLPR